MKKKAEFVSGPLKYIIEVALVLFLLWIIYEILVKRVGGFFK